MCVMQKICHHTAVWGMLSSHWQLVCQSYNSLPCHVTIVHYCRDEWTIRALVTSKPPTREWRNGIVLNVILVDESVSWGFGVEGGGAKGTFLSSINILPPSLPFMSDLCQPFWKSLRCSFSCFLPLGRDKGYMLEWDCWELWTWI